MNQLLSTGTIELAKLIKKKNVSPVEIVKAHIEQIQKVNPKLNALVQNRFSLAQKEAILAEKALIKGKELGPLHGVPCTVKEMLCFKGFPFSIGCKNRRNLIATYDATVVERIRKAGAIPLGITNLPEMAFWMECYNLNYGRTNNPYRLGHTCGGSSGGEAALIASGGSPFGIGSDGGGSIRLPSGFCGIFGHKPSARIVPNTGHAPLDEKKRHQNPPKIPRCVTIGPMARCATDLFPLLQIMIGPDGIDPYVQKCKISAPEQVNFKGKRILLFENPKVFLTSRPHHDIKKTLFQAAKALKELGAHVEIWEEKDIFWAMDMWSAVMHSESDDSLQTIIAHGQPFNLFYELVRCVLGSPNYTLPVLMACFGEQIFKIIGNVEKLTSRLEKLRQKMQNQLGDDGIGLMPIYPTVAPKHYFPSLWPFEFVYAALINALGFPATTIPMGLNYQGLPISIQAIAKHGRDDLTIATAMALEKAIGGWKAPEWTK